MGGGWAAFDDPFKGLGHSPTAVERKALIGGDGFMASNVNLGGGSGLAKSVCFPSPFFYPSPFLI